MSEVKLFKSARRVIEAVNAIGISAAQAEEVLKAFGDAVFKATSADEHQRHGDILMIRSRLQWNPFEANRLRRLAKEQYAWATQKRSRQHQETE